MASFVSYFKAWILAIATVVAIESAIHAVAPSDPIDRTNFLQFSFARPEPTQRLFTFHKLRAFAHANPTIVQSGDSSGFYGIDPRVVMKHLPAGVSYLNMSCCANLGYRGYYNIFEFMAQRSPSLQYMVLHITPYTMPRPELWDADGANLWGPPGMEVFGGTLDHEFIGPWRITHVPSMAYRGQVSNFVYYLGPLVNRTLPIVDPEHSAGPALARGNDTQTEAPVDILRAVTKSAAYLEFLRNYRESNGWTPEVDQRGGVYASECDIQTPEFFNYKTMQSKTYLEEVLDSFVELAERHHAVLVVVFQPVACVYGTGKSNEKSRMIVEAFKRAHPEVEIPFPLIETWPVDLFSVPAHVRREHTDLIGNRLGQAMAQIVARRGYRPTQ